MKLNIVFIVVYGTVGAGTLERKKKKGWRGNILGPLLHNLQLAMTIPISRGANFAGDSTTPSI